MNTSSVTCSTGFPFGHTRTADTAELRHIPTVDLIAEIESWQWLALEVAKLLDGSRAYCEFQLTCLVDELERRKRLWASRPDDPLRPLWPRRDDHLKARVEAVKARWPIQRFCEELCLMQLIPASRGRWRGRCPLPGHRKEKTPSFFLYEDTDSAYCYGCGRGGDVLQLTKFMLNTDRFNEALTRLEREGGAK